MSIQSLKEQSPGNQKIIGTVLSFIISLAIFILIRVIGVIYFAKTFVQIIDFSPTAASDFMVWIGIGAMLLIAFAMLNFTISSDKLKLNADVGSSLAISIGFFWLISYNYVGFVYPSMFANADISQRLLEWTYYIAIFGIYGTVDLFFFWIGLSVAFHVVFYIFASVDLEKSLLIPFNKKRLTIKSIPGIRNEKKYTALDFLLINIISVFLTLLIIYLPIAMLYPDMASTIFSAGGIILLLATCMINTLFYILSKRIIVKSQEIFFFVFASLAFTVINIFFIVIQALLMSIILILFAIIVIELVSNILIPAGKH